MGRRSRRNWFLLAAVLIITTIGFGTTVLGVIGEHLATPGTDVILVVAVGLLISTLVGYLTHQQRQLTGMNRQLQTLKEEAHEHDRRQNNRLYALFEVSHVMSLETDPQSVFDCITQACLETFRCDQASLMLFNADTQKLEVRSASGHLNLSEVIGTQRNIGEGIAGWAAKHRKALLLGSGDQADHPPGVRLGSKTVSAAMVVPIILRDELVGVVNVSTRHSGADYDEDDLRALQVFAANAGACIRHAEQSQWMRQTIQRLQDKQPARA